MTIHFRQDDRLIIVYGQTYRYRQTLKEQGARFDGNNKTWNLPINDKNLAFINQLCQPTDSDTPPTVFKKNKTDSTNPDLTIRELLERVAKKLHTLFPSSIWVVGEVQNLTKKDHYYYRLIEAEAGQRATTVEAVIWQEQVKKIIAERGEDCLQEGLKIRCLCTVNLYRERGSISLQVSDIDPNYTRGELAIAREKLLRKLRAQNKDTANKGLTMPRMPRTIGLITAEGSRAYSDFCHQLESLGVAMQVHFRPTPMQGEDVLREVPLAINQLSYCDVIVITRGGGSASDLRWFDSEQVAMAIVNAPIPIVAAIGHHDDVCVAEEICYLRQKTPTAAADYIWGLQQRAVAYLDNLATNLVNCLETFVNRINERYRRIIEELAVETTNCLQRGTMRIVQLSHDVISAAERANHQRRDRLRNLSYDLATIKIIDNKLQQLDGYEKKLATVDPRSWLAKGWTRLYHKDNILVKSVTQVAINDRLQVRLSDGQLQLTVIGTNKND